jgi:hypothetical protein
MLPVLSGLTRNDDDGFDTDAVPMLLTDDVAGETLLSLLLALPALPIDMGKESREYPILACPDEVRRPTVYLSSAERDFLFARFSAICCFKAARPMLLGENRNEAFCIASLVRAG